MRWSCASCVFTCVLYKNINIELIHCREFNASALIIHCIFLHALCGIYNAALSPKASLNLFVDEFRLLFLCKILSIRHVNVRMRYGAFLLCPNQLFFCYNTISVHSCRVLASRSCWFSQTKLLMNLIGLWYSLNIQYDEVLSGYRPGQMVERWANQRFEDHLCPRPPGTSLTMVGKNILTKYIYLARTVYATGRWPLCLDQGCVWTTTWLLGSRPLSLFFTLSQAWNPVTKLFTRNLDPGKAATEPAHRPVA
jgi:hypothetical protein